MRYAICWVVGSVAANLQALLALLFPFAWCSVSGCSVAVARVPLVSISRLLRVPIAWPVRIPVAWSMRSAFTRAAASGTVGPAVAGTVRSTAAWIASMR